MDLTICVPCLGRPERTKRLIEQVANQTIGDWEAYFIGDSCPDFQKLIDSGYFDAVRKGIKTKNCALITSNMPNRTHGWGYAIRNKIKELASGKYFIYIDNDDCIKENHFENYLSGIMGTEYDFVYFDTLTRFNNSKRIARLEHGLIGHSEIIIRTQFLKTLPPHTNEYGHDWTLINNMIIGGGKHKKSNNPPTYIVMGAGSQRETEID